MKNIYIFASFLLAYSIDMFAQGNEIDAYTFTNQELGGTARSMSMGGAFGALGGDMSVISHNPAGLGIYRSSEVSGTIDFASISANTVWSGLSTTSSRKNLGMDNFGIEMYFPTSSGPIQNWNFAVSYNKIKNYTRRYRMESTSENYSMADYIASRASNAFINNGKYSGLTTSEMGSDNAYYDASLSGQWLPILGYGAGMFGNMTGAASDVYQSAFGKYNNNGDYEIFSPNNSLLTVIESGSIDEYNVGLGTNISNILFLGGSISFGNINYRMESDYEELFDNGSNRDDHLYLQNHLTTEGTAVAVNIGAIVNLQNVRLGVAYNSPRYYMMTDYYNASAGTYIAAYDQPLFEDRTPSDAYSEYTFSTPGKWLFSGAVIFGQTALISVDYELMNYSKMRFANRDGDTYNFFVNNYISEDYIWGQMFKIGGELKITPQFAVRAGYARQTTPMKKQLYDNDLEVYPSGTIPHFTVSQEPTNYFTAGLGYRFSPNFYIDLACIYRVNNAKAYAFSNTYYDEPEHVYSTPASLDNKSTRLALTLGYKF